MNKQLPKIFKKLKNLITKEIKILAIITQEQHDKTTTIRQ